MNLIFIYEAASTLLSLFIGLFILFKNPGNLINRIFFILSIFITGYAGSNFLLEYNTFVLNDPAFAYKLAIFFASLHPPTLLLFSLYFPRVDISLNYRKIFIVYMLWLFFAFFSFSNMYIKEIKISNGERLIDFGVLYYFFAAFFCAFIVSAFLNLLKTLHKPTISKKEQNQIKYILTALVLAYSIGTVFSLVLPVFFHYSKTEFIGPIGPLILVIGIAHAITKTRLMDITVIINRSFAWSLTTASLGIIYIGFVWLYGTFISNKIDLLFLIWTVIYGVIVGQFFNKIRLFLQTTGEKTFLQGKMDFKEAVGEILQDLAKVVSFDDLDKLLEHIRIEHVESEHLKLLNPNQVDNSLINELSNKKNAVERNKKIYVPCFSSKGITGILEVGRKLSEDTLDQEEIEILKLLAPQFSIVLDRIRPYEQIKSELVLEHEKVDKAQKEIEKVSKLATLGTLAAGLAHEIKNPMTVLRSRAERGLNRLEDKDFIKESNELMIKNIDRTLGIVERMLKFGKISGGQGKIKIQNVINESFNLLSEKIKDHNILVDKEFIDNDTVLGNLDSLSESFLNLILNSIDAMQKGGTLKVKTSSAKITDINNHEKDAVKVEIKDTGEGIPKENLSRVFDPFFTTRHTGTGLGLSIVQRIILEEHKGSLDIESDHGKGTKATIILPK